MIDLERFQSLHQKVLWKLHDHLPISRPIHVKALNEATTSLLHLRLSAPSSPVDHIPENRSPSNSERSLLETRCAGSQPMPGYSSKTYAASSVWARCARTIEICRHEVQQARWRKTLGAFEFTQTHFAKPNMVEMEFRDWDLAHFQLHFRINRMGSDTL